jgi:hypothetical protein
MVRDVLRQVDDGRSVIVVCGRTSTSMKAFQGASHVYQVGLWTVRPGR